MPIPHAPFSCDTSVALPPLTTGNQVIFAKNSDRSPNECQPLRHYPRATYAPGWEVGISGNADPCPWMTDLPLCWSTCYWTGQVPDQGTYPEWMDDCQSLAQDWVRLCVVPD